MLANLSVIVSIPFAASIMIAAATKWNPLLIALFGSIGGSIGELSGYYAGYLGKKIAIRGEVIGYGRVEHWIHHCGNYETWHLKGLLRERKFLSHRS